jgi:hypothetical protein
MKESPKRRNMLATAASIAGTHDVNEDWFAVTPTAAIVLDGVTSVADTGCLHGVRWYVEKLGSRILGNLSLDNLELREILAQSIDDVAALHAQTCDLDHPATPAATVAIVRVQQDDIEHLVLADASVAIDSTDGMRVITDARVNVIVAEERKAATQHPADSDAYRRFIENSMIEQLKWRNKPGGYWVASVDPGAVREALVGRIALDNVRRVALLSDGASRLVDKYGIATWPQLLDILEQAGPTGLIQQVRAADEADSDRHRWARYKVSDDATAIYVRF